MKKMRKLIPALAMLLISAVMMSTASFAWFSMNTTVSASGMSVTAKNESKYLQIISGADTSFHATDAQITATATKANNALRPTALVASINDEGASITSYQGSTTLVWAEAFSNDPDVYTKPTTNKYNDVTTSATATDNTNYHTLYNIFQVRMNPTTGVENGGVLSVSNVKVTASGEGNETLLPALRVAIIGTDKGAIYNSAGTLVAGDASIITAVSTTPSQVKVFVFFDGEDPAAYTNAVSSTASYAVEFTLAIS